jgi:hypothetical protein
MSISRTLLALALLLLLALGARAEAPARHELRVRIEPAAATLAGEARLAIPATGAALRVRLAESLELTGARWLVPGDERPVEAGLEGPADAALRTWVVDVPTGASGTLAVAWEGTLPSAAAATADAGHLLLEPSDGWYPLFGDHPAGFDLVAELPEGWQIVSEALPVPGPTESGQALETVFPVPGLHLVAGRWEEEPAGADGPVTILGTGEPNSARVRTLRHRAARAWRGLEQSLGSAPAPRLRVVVLPVAAPRLAPTLAVLPPARLDELADAAALRELLLWAWWGGGVYPAADGEDWTAGLRAYLAELLAPERPDEAALRPARWRWLVLYAEAVRAGALPGADRGEAAAGSLAAAGATARQAMIFHMLRRQVGPRTFSAALRRLGRVHVGQPTGWNELGALFNGTARQQLNWFFEQWFGRAGAPMLSLDDISVTPLADRRLVRVAVGTGGAWRLSIPLRITTVTGEQASTTGLSDPSAGEAMLQLRVDSDPALISVDPGLDLLRLLGGEELPPALAPLASAPADLVLVGEARDPTLQRAARALGARLGAGAARVRAASDAVPDELAAARRVWLLGRAERETLERLGIELPPGVQLGDRQLAVAGRRAAGPAALLLVVPHPGRVDGAMAVVDALDPASLNDLLARIGDHLLASWVLLPADGVPVSGRPGPPRDPLAERLAVSAP